MKREIPVEQAVGMALAHDLTRIVPGEFKGVAFRTGHVIREEDIPLLLDIGKRNIYVLELGEDELHESDAAVRMAQAIAGDGLSQGDPHEGKVVLKARCDGVLMVAEEPVLEVNLIDGLSLTTRQPFIHVAKGSSVAGVRPIPLVIEREKVEQVESLSAVHREKFGTAIIDVLPYPAHRVALVTTGSEIKEGRIQDKAGPALREKFAKFGIEVVSQVFPGDEIADITREIVEACDRGATIVCVTGGMSVDPDDRSPGAISRAATEVITYGTPMLPGSMLMLAYRGDTAIFGLPGAVIYDPVTSFDILLPRALARVRMTKRDIARHGTGGWLNP